MGLLHAGMNVVARIAQLGDLLGQQFDALGRVAEDDALVDLQLFGNSYWIIRFKY